MNRPYDFDAIFKFRAVPLENVTNININGVK